MQFQSVELRSQYDDCDTAFIAIFSIGSKLQDYELHPIQCCPWYTKRMTTSIIPHFCKHLVYSLWFTHIITGCTSTLSVWNILHFVFSQIIDWNICFSGKMYWVKIYKNFKVPESSQETKTFDQKKNLVPQSENNFPLSSQDINAALLLRGNRQKKNPGL